VALTKIITDVIDDSIRIGSGSLATISGSSASTGSFGRVIVAEMGNSDLTSVSSSISTRITTNSGSFAAASSSYSSASGSLSTRVNLLEGSGSINDLVTDSGSFSTRVNLLEGSGSIFESSASFSTRVNLLEGSGSIFESSASFSTRVNLLEGSGSITESSASFSTRVSDLKTDSGSFSTRVSDLKTDSGSFSTRVSDLVTDSGSFSTRVTTAEASGALFDGDGEVTFAGATITGTLTAQEVHTEFISASVTVSTGSNIFGDETGDVHQFTGSIETSGSIILDTLGGNVSGSIVSTGSFGAANIAGMTVSNLVDVSSSISTRVSDLVTDSGSFSTRVSDLNLSLSGSTTLISGSAISTGSFGSVVAVGKVFIDQNANNSAIDIDSEATAANAIAVDASALTTGAAAYFYSDSTRTADFPLVEIQDDNATTGDGYGLKVRVDGDGDLIRGMAQGNNTKFVVSNTGAVGIGNGAPGADLDVTGGQFHLGTNAASDIYMSPDDTNQVIRFSKSAAGSLDIIANGGLIHLNVNGNVGIDDGAPSAKLAIDQDNNVTALSIDAESTTENVMTFLTPTTTTATIFAAVNANSLTTGRIAYFHSDSSTTNARKLVEIHNDHASATGATALTVTQDADQKSIVIDSASTTNHVMRMDGPLTTTGVCFLIDDVDALTTGNIAKFHSNSADTGTRELVRIHNDHASATNATPLSIVQDASSHAMKIEQNADGNGIIIDQNGNGDAIQIDFEGTSGNCIEIQAPTSTTGTCLLIQNANALTTGGVAEFSSNSSATNTRSVVHIQNDHASATGATALKVVQDAAAVGLSVDHNADSTSILIDSEATTANVINVPNATTTTGAVLNITDANNLTTGFVAGFRSNSASTNARNIVDIRNDHTSADNAVPLYIKQDGNNKTMQVEAGDASFTADMVLLNAVGRSSSDAFSFIKTFTDGDNDVQHFMRGDGAFLADGAYSDGGADYAEYFESKDGKAIAVGKTVKLDGDKIVPCEDGDTPIGVIRPLDGSVVIGNAAPLKWGSKYLKDDYGSTIKEEFTVTTWIEIDDDIEGSDGMTDIQYHTDKIPSDVTVPSDATVVSTEKDGSKLIRKKLNPDYDESKTYKPREERDSWNIVGLVGQIPITKGQPMASTWIKMKDVSNTVELWFVK